MVDRPTDEQPEPGTDPGREVEVDEVLRSKYLDYCSARICEVFLSLSDERIYELMEEAADEAGLTAGSLGFQSMVSLVTGKLKESVPLPELESWARDYQENPERYDPLLLGLWETALD
ncbi:MAG: hypothetical protein ACE5JR_09415, partial [Gemmatimonadota bacterium]